MQTVQVPCGKNSRNYCVILFRSGVLNLFPVKHPRVIKQATRTPRLAGKAGISGFHIVASQQRKIRQNLHGVFNRHTFSSSTGY